MNYEDLNTKIKLIQKQFLSCVPIENIDWHDIFDHLTWDYQETLILSTVELPLVLQFPIKIGYQKAFVKHILHELEERQFDIHDFVYNSLGQIVSLADSADCYKHYTLKGDQIITLKESANLISEGTTGLCSWQAAFALSEWCLTHKDFFCGKTVLELGSGVGLTGLTIAFGCDPKKITLSDCHSTVLNTLVANVNQNITGKSSVDVDVLNLPWEDVCETTCGSLNPDVVIAADVVYDLSLFAPLVSAIVYFLSGSCFVEFVLACTVRNTNTLEIFLKLLGDNNLTYQDLEVPPQGTFAWSTESPIRIFSIKKGIEV